MDTLSPGPHLTHHQVKVLITLLAVIAALLVLLVGGLAAGAVWTARTVARLSPGGDPARLEQAVGQATRSVDELSQRQEQTAQGMRAVSAHAMKDIESFAERRRVLEDTSGGPLKKMETLIRLNQLMVEEQMAMLRAMAGGEAVAGKGVRPLASEHQARRPAPGQR